MTPPQQRQRQRPPHRFRRQGFCGVRVTTLFLLAAATLLVLPVLWGAIHYYGSLDTKKPPGLSNATSPIYDNETLLAKIRLRRSFHIGGTNDAPGMSPQEMQTDAETMKSRNAWYLYADLTARQHTASSCVVCMTANPLLLMVPSPLSFTSCAVGYDVCPASCLQFLANSDFERSTVALMCGSFDFSELPTTTLNPPQTKLVDYSREYECFYRSDGTTRLGNFTGKCSTTWLVTKKVATQAAVIDGAPTEIRPLGRAFWKQDKRIADIFWQCGGDVLSHLPAQWTGLCTRVMLVQPTNILSDCTSGALRQKLSHRLQRSKPSLPEDKVHVDVIGVPRGVSDEFKARTAIGGMFPATNPLFGVSTETSKNAKWINHIYYNQQRLITVSPDAFEAAGYRTKVTSLMQLQNRMALDMLLAEKRGVCAMFADTCCTFVPNNTAPEGAFAGALAQLRSLSAEFKSSVATDASLWDWVSESTTKGVALFLILLGLLAWCVVPLLLRRITRDLNQKIAAQMTLMKVLTESQHDRVAACIGTWNRQQQKNGRSTTVDEPVYMDLREVTL